MVQGAIDLTLDSDDEPELRQRNKRRRVIAPEPSGSDVVIMRDTGDSDVEDISPQEFRNALNETTGRKVSTGNGNAVGAQEDDDVIVTASFGLAATLDMPHPRPDCAAYHFTGGTAKANSSHCAKCYCYVCDVKASECEFWGTGERAQDHANAAPKASWNRLRQAAKDGDRAKLAAKFEGASVRKSKRTSRRS